MGQCGFTGWASGAAGKGAWNGCRLQSPDWELPKHSGPGSWWGISAPTRLWEGAHSPEWRGGNCWVPVPGHRWCFCILGCCTKLRCLIRQIKLGTPKSTADKTGFQSGCGLKGEVSVRNIVQSTHTAIAINSVGRVGSKGRNRPAVWWALRTVVPPGSSGSLPASPARKLLSDLCIRVYRRRTSMLTSLEKVLNIQMHLLEHGRLGRCEIHVLLWSGELPSSAGKPVLMPCCFGWQRCAR